MAADAARLGHGDVYITRCQTAGRGQRGNSWEAAPGQNLTLSMLLQPTAIRPAEAFTVSMLISIAIAETVGAAISQPHRVAIKWPNDIYIDEGKVCGILIENSFSTVYDRAIAGIGLNVNQQQFLSDAPNPVSMRQTAGHDFDLDNLLDTLTGNILREINDYMSRPDIAALSGRYHALLWRGTGIHPWLDRLTGLTFEAAISHVEPDGTLVMATDRKSVV